MSRWHVILIETSLGRNFLRFNWFIIAIIFKESGFRTAIAIIDIAVVFTATTHFLAQCLVLSGRHYYMIRAERKFWSQTWNCRPRDFRSSHILPLMLRWIWWRKVADSFDDRCRRKWTRNTFGIFASQPDILQIWFRRIFPLTWFDFIL